MEVLELKQDTPETKKQRSAISVKNVLFATDFSATSETALPYASAICHRFGCTLHVAHVLSDANLLLMTGGVDYMSVETVYEDAHSQAEEKVRQVASRLSNIPHRTYVRHGQVWPNLSDIVSENKIDLIIVGTHGRSGLGKFVLGSVAEDILRSAPCPVLTVGPRVRGHARLPELHGTDREIAPVDLELHRIVYATNFTPASLKVARVAISLAEEFESQLTLLHVIEDYSELEKRPGPIETGVCQLQALVPRNATLAYLPDPVIEFGIAWECIVNTAAEREADLIVLGARPRDGRTRMPWSTVHRVVAHANCPVLTVRG